MSGKRTEQAPSFSGHVNELYTVIMQSPIPLAIFRGRDFVIEMGNEAMFNTIWRKTRDQVLGKKLKDVFPELWEQKYPELLTRVMDTGMPHNETESVAAVHGNDGTKLFYLDYEYAPLFEHDGSVSGILITVSDVSEKVLARKRAEESEARLKIAIESAEIGTFDWNIAHSEFIYSERMAAIFGYEATENLVHTSFSKQIHPEDAALRIKAHEESFVTGKLFYEARFIKQDGTICWLRLNGKVFFDEAGKPERIYGTALDITFQKMKTYALEKEVKHRTSEIQRKNEELRMSEERYHRMTEEVQDYAILLLSIDGTVLNWNRGAEKIKGYTEKEIIGQNFNIFYLPEDRENNVPASIIAKAREHGRAAQEGWRVRKDQTVFWASIVVTALHDKQNNIIGFSKVTRDLTERKIFEDRLKQYTAELEFQNKELEQFAYIASHDLQEPLRKIQTFSDMLERHVDDKEALNLYLGKIKSSAKRMTELIRAVLNYSRLSNDTIEKEEIDLNLLVEIIRDDFELLIAEKNAEIVCDKLPSIKGIPLQMTQLFSNLIGNGLKFSDENPKVTISSKMIENHESVPEIALEPGVKYLEVVFSDNGIGFEKQYAGQIFKMFQRLHDKQSYSGTGIGLALCKKIVENHHGFITAASEAGQGAVFTIYLPV